MDSEIFVLIPAYNNEETIKQVVSESKRVCKNVLVVDDGSEDKTFEIAKKTGVNVLKHKVNRGKGQALKTGFDYLLKKYPRLKYIVTIDADMQYSPAEIKNLAKPLKNDTVDFVMGYRNWDNVPLRHRLGNAVWRGLFNLLFGTSLKDTNCGFVALSKSAIERIGEAYGGYIIENYMLAKAVKNKLRIKQVPVNVSYDHKSKIPRGVRVVLGVSIFILREGLSYRLSKLFKR